MKFSISVSSSLKLKDDKAVKTFKDGICGPLSQMLLEGGYAVKNCDIELTNEASKRQNAGDLMAKVSLETLKKVIKGGTESSKVDKADIQKGLCHIQQKDNFAHP